MKHKGRASNIAHFIPLCMDGPVIFFDGVCNLCNGAVQFIIRYDPKGTFRFSALQNEAAKAMLASHESALEGVDSIILLESGKVYTRSAAALRIARRLNGGWSLLYSLIVLPAFFRDFFYNIIARNRYRVWGEKDRCMVPSPELQQRFLS